MQIKWRQVTSLIALIVLAAVLVSLLLGFGLYGVPEGHFTPEIGLTILLVTGVTGLVLILILAVVILHALGISDPSSAFGLPEGSIRAVLAIGLVLIFSMVSVFLYSQARNVGVSKVESITPEQLAGIPATRIVSSSTNADNSSRFDVVIADDNQASNDIAKTLLTTVGTLAVAVAGFYFGTRSVAAARGETVSSEPVIRIVDPASAKKDEPNPVKIEISGKNLKSPKAVTFAKGPKTLELKEITSSDSMIRGELIPKDLKDADVGKYKVTASYDGAEDSLDEGFEIADGETRGKG